MHEAEGWFICRTGYVESVRAIGVAAGRSSTRFLREEWASFTVIEVDQALVESAAVLALENDLRSLDSLHLAAALVLPADDLVFATWDRRLHAAARGRDLAVLPETRP